MGYDFQMASDKEEMAQEALNAGGALVEPTPDGIKVHLAIDADNPLQIFDRLNELELDMVNRAGRDLTKIAAAGRFVDDIRFKAKTMLAKMGVEVNIDVKESYPAIVSEPVDIEHEKLT